MLSTENLSCLSRLYDVSADYLLIVSRSQEKHFSIGDMIGEKVVNEPDGSFSIGW